MQLAAATCCSGSSGAVAVRMESATNPLSVLSLNINQLERRAQKLSLCWPHILTYFCATPKYLGFVFHRTTYHNLFSIRLAPLPHSGKFKIENKHSKNVEVPIFWGISLFARLLICWSCFSILDFFFFSLLFLKFCYLVCAFALINSFRIIKLWGI